MSVGNRIRILRRSLNMSQPELAKKAGVGQSTISDLENDKKSTSAENMESIAQVLGKSTKFLLTGKELDPSEINWKAEHDAYYAQLKKEIAKNNTLDEVEIRYFENIPISCGSGSFGEILERDAKSITVSHKPLLERKISTKDCIALPAIGDSMFPTIKNGDTVYVDMSRNTVKDGKVFAICHGGLFKFKRLYQLPLGGIRIVSDNSAEYPEERLTAQDIIDQQFEIIGWAWSWQSMENW